MSSRTILVRASLVVALAASAAGCGGGRKSDIGLVDVPRITQNWPKFQNYQNQLSADAYALQRSNRSAGDKAREQQRLQARFAQAQTELAGEVSGAAKQVAAQKGLKYVLTRQYVGYGGVDITGDVEKILKIEEKATPKP